MSIVGSIQKVVSGEIKNLYGLDMEPSAVLVNETKPEFEGDYTVVLFALTKSLRKSPEALGNELGEKLIAGNPHLFSRFNVIKGFLNLSVGDEYWLQFLNTNYSDEGFGKRVASGKKIMVEYSSPNTNKPLHLGHLRNNFLGWSIAEIFKANGSEVVKTCIANDRGIHICKSMVAWQLFANGATPESTGIKGDHLVGDYYVRFGLELSTQVADLIASGMKKEDAEREAPIMKAAQEMLVDWEAGKTDVVELWQKMNAWVYAGFEKTYERIGSDFDKTYYESNTYLLGKEIVQKGLAKNVFYKKPDGSIWIDLTAEGLDEKVVMRKDGTSVYITQDIGLAEQKYYEFKCDSSIYVVGDEQNYHFKVLKHICQKLQIPAADDIFHLSYGMVELPTGRMKTREGTVVDADDIIDEMVSIAAKHTEELGKVKDFTGDELHELYDILALGALKFFILRVDPKKRMVFNPEESIEFHGFTGPFIQYTHARTKSILRREQPKNLSLSGGLLGLEKNVIMELEKYPSILEEAAREMNPSVIANYVFKVAQVFNTFFTELRVLNAEIEEKKELILQLSMMTVNVIKSAMGLLGIRVPERM